MTVKCGNWEAGINFQTIKSNCITPLVEILQWSPTAIRKLKVLTVACNAVAAPTKLSCIIYSLPPSLYCSPTFLPLSLSLSLPLPGLSNLRDLCLLFAKLLPVTGVLYPMFLLLGIFFRTLPYMRTGIYLLC